MMDRCGFVASTAGVTVFAWFFAGCGSYANIPAGDAGTSGSAVTAGTGGSTTTAGSGGGGVGGSVGGSNAAGTSGSGGVAGTGGAAAGAGSGGQAGGGTGGAPAGGSSGASGASGASGGGQVSCTDVAPCGGDVVGTWSAASCEMTISGVADMVPTGLGCTEAPATGAISVSGTWTATGDGMFTDKTTTTGEAFLELAPECLEISGFATTCDRIVLDPLGLTSVVCVDNPATEGCTCTATINQSGGLGLVSIDSAFNSPEGSTGMYTTADNALVTTVAGVDSEYSYCVGGNTLTMNITTPSKVGTLTGPIVLQKQ